MSRIDTPLPGRAHIHQVSQMKKIINHSRFGEIVAQKTRRAKRISVSVRPPAKVRLTVPWGCSMKEGIEFLASREEWIAATLEKVAKKHPVKLIEPGYSTLRRSLFFNPAHTGEITGRVTANTITVSHPADMTYDDPRVQDVARRAAITALRKEAREALPPLVERLAREHGFRYGKVTVRASTSRWGSCSGENNISLSIFLLCIPEHLCEYVVLHELCHTKHKDHSPRFHRLLDSLLGGREKELSREMQAYRPDVV